jgi:hypothetical protein
MTQLTKRQRQRRRKRVGRAHLGPAAWMAWIGRHWRLLFAGPQAIVYPPDTSLGAQPPSAGGDHDPQIGSLDGEVPVAARKHDR